MHAYPDQATSSATVKTAKNAAAITIEVIMIAGIIGELPMQAKRKEA